MSRSNQAVTCESCETKVVDFSVVCPQCTFPLPLQEVDSFQLMGVPPSFSLDQVEMEKSYFTLQRQVHPDRFVAAETHIKDLAAQWSTQLNHSYQTLKDPLKRAQALYVVLEGKVITEPSENTTLLQDMMELQERLLEDPEAGMQQVSHQLDDCVKALEAAFDSDLEEIPSLLEKYSYLDRLRSNE